jgi:hypothetical protein
MTRISKNELSEIATTIIVANTPISLLTGLRRSAAMNKLREWTLEELVEHYDFLTARSRQTEIVVALSYAVLIAIFLRAKTVDDPPIDPSYLRWGEQIRRHLLRTNASTGTMEVEPPKPSIVDTRSSSANSVLVGYDGRPLSLWEELK